MDGIVLGNRYLLKEKIGTGGMAYVYKALDQTLDRIVAIKILKEEFLDDESFVKRFHAEAQSVAKLSNQNIVGVYDVSIEQTKHYIVMEYIEGVTLSDYIESKKVLSNDEAMSIAIQICNALIHAHKNNIVHRDIKPHNILLAKDGIVKVADFGIAKVTTNKTVTLSGKTIGSVHYFSPEQARGGFVDHRTDLYSLGCVMYEMTTGQLPYDGDTPVVVAVKHLQEPVIAPILINKNVSEDVNKVILKAMSKSVDERYQSANDVKSDIEAIMQGKELSIEFDITLDFINNKRNKNVYTRDFTPAKKVKATKKKREEYDFNLAYKTQKKYTFSKMIAVISAVILIALMLFYGLSELSKTLIVESKEYAVLDYSNYFYEDIKTKLQDDFDIVVMKQEEFNDDVIEGVITDQDIAPGITFKDRATNSITFTVSLGPELIEIKDYTSFDYRIAERDLIDLGLNTAKVEAHSLTVAKGDIIRTDPGALIKVEPESEITIYVSIGPDLKEVTIPDFIGMTKEEFDLALSNNNLTLGSIAMADINSKTATVSEQFPKAGETVYEKDSVHVKFTENNVQGNRLLVEYSITPSNIADLSGSVKVYVQIRPSDTLEVEAIYNEKHLITEFPLLINLPIPIDGKIEVMVIYDNIYTETFDLYYSNFKENESLTIVTPEGVTPDDNTSTEGGN